MMFGCEQRDLASRCQCGRISYAVSSEPVEVTVCHCRMCQKAAGVSDFICTGCDVLAALQSAYRGIAGKT